MMKGRGEKRGSGKQGKNYKTKEKSGRLEGGNHVLSHSLFSSFFFSSNTAMAISIMLGFTLFANQSSC